MAGFEDAPTREKVELPADLPDAEQAIKDGRKAGQGFRSDDGFLYRLVAARVLPPTWRRDSRAEQKPPTTAPAAQAPAAQAQTPAAQAPAAQAGTRK